MHADQALKQDLPANHQTACPNARTLFTVLNTGFCMLELRTVQGKTAELLHLKAITL
jgi:hypothetical protein